MTLTYDNYLEHYGVKGMKWGVRKGDSKKSVSNERYERIKESQNRSFQVTSKSGDILDVEVNKSPKLVNWIASKTDKATYDAVNSPTLNLLHNGKNVGDASIQHVSKDELNLVWLGINPKHRGKGYASAAFDSAVEYGKQKGYKKLTLEVPGYSPDARHIYEKRGFKVVKEPTQKELQKDFIWGGLTHMSLDLDSIRHSSNYDDDFDEVLLKTFTQMSEEEWNLVFDDIEHSITYDDYLEHYGIKGMKWGVRREEGPDGLVGKNEASKEPIDDSNKSKRRIHLEAKYISKGNDQATAEMKADRRIKTDKVLLAVGGVAVGTAVAIGAKNYHTKMFKGVNLDMGVEMKNVNVLGDKQDLDRRLFVSLEERDSKKYRGLLAQSLRMNEYDSTIYESTLKAKENIKAPSQRQAKKLYEEFTNNSRHAKPYSEFNRNLIRYTEQNESFYEFMSKKGYNAVLDYNDQFISGYNSKRPLILFNAESSTTKTGQRIVSEQESKKLNKIQLTQLYGQKLAPTVGVGVAYLGAHKTSKMSQRYSQVNKYFEEHPNSEKTYAEVYASLDKKQGDKT